MDNLFLFQFCLRNLFVKNEDVPCYARHIIRKGALMLAYKNTEQVSNYKESERQGISHRIKKIARVKIVPAREHLLRE